MIQSWLSLVPPLLVIAVTIVTHRIIFALSLGVATAAFLATNGSLFESLSLISSTTVSMLTSGDNIYVYGFFITLAVLIALLTTLGSATAFARAITKKIKTAPAAEYASMLVSFCLSLDDYLSILTTGSIMNPLADRMKVARLKLAFLVHSLAGPVVILIPISSWVATIVAYIDQAGISTNTHETVRITADPLFAYLGAMPFMFYSFLVIISTWCIIHYRLSFGSMKYYEKKQIEVSVTHTNEQGNGNIFGLLLPLATLIFGIIIGLAYSGDYYFFGGTHTFMESIKYSAHPFLVMVISTLCAIAVSTLISIHAGTLNSKTIPLVLQNSISLIHPSILMVLLATILSNLLANNVGTGQYLAQVLLGTMPLFLVPFMFFVVSFLCSATTGSAWGTFALIIPIAIPMLTTISGLPFPISPESLPLLSPVLAAIFSGAVCGNHISPLADTTILTATSTQTDPIDHATTQFPYAIPAFVGSTFGFLSVGLMVATYRMSIGYVVSISLGISIITCLITLLLLNLLLRK